MADGDLTGDIGQTFSDLAERLKNPSKILDDIAQSVVSIESFAVDINKAFGETRNRVYELKTGFADAIPGIERLGGSVYDVQKTIEGIGLASNRNLIGTEKQIKSLYAASVVTTKSVEDLVNGFSDIGVGVDQMSKQIEDSVKYIQSIGGNTKEVFKVVTDNMDQLNLYQFEGGVAGLTKMAAQASMLRYDMRTTTSLADGVYKPERAIEVASAFQRLGLAVGDLGDPFKLMNDSIMDPQGLQDSLIKVSEKFTYFDDKTKTFKISPEGVLHLKELEAQTGVSAREMTKLGLASAEVNRRISQIKSFNLNIDEKDTQLLANLSRINDKGKLEVYVKDENGERSYKELKDIGRQQLEATLKEQKEQKERPEMTLEEIARSQLTLSEKLTGDVAGIYHGLTYGFASSRASLDLTEVTTRLSNIIGGSLSKNLSNPKGGRQIADNIRKDLLGLFSDLKSGKSIQNSIGDLLEKFGKESQNASTGLKTAVKESFIDIYNNLTNQSNLEVGLKKELGEFLKKLNVNVTPTITTAPTNTVTPTKPYTNISEPISQNTNAGGKNFNLAPTNDIAKVMPPNINIYDALFYGTKNISGKPEESKDVANNFSKGVTPVALGGKDKKDNTIYQKIDQNIKIDYAFSPIEVKISGDNGKLDATKTQDLINTIVNNRLSTLIKDIAKQSKDKILVPIIAGDGTNVTNFNTSVKIG